MTAVRNLSQLSRLYFQQRSGMLDRISEKIAGKSADNLADWFREQYLPLRLILRTAQYSVVPRDLNDDFDKDKFIVSYELMPMEDLVASSIDRNTCLFLNELTGHSHVYSDAAKAQRRQLRKHLLSASLNSIAQATSSPAFKSQQLDIFEQAKLAGAIIIVQHLITQYNSFEFNRVLVSRECYAVAMRHLFTWQEDGAKKRRFMQLTNDILDIVVKWSSEERSPLRTLIVERLVQIYTSIALVLESERKREAKLREDARLRREARRKREASEAAKKGD